MLMNSLYIFCFCVDKAIRVLRETHNIVGVGAGVGGDFDKLLDTGVRGVLKYSLDCKSR